MPDYRRYGMPDGAYFFTVNPLEHYPNDLLVWRIDNFRTVVIERLQFISNSLIDDE